MSHDHDEKDAKGEPLSPAVEEAISNMGSAFFYKDKAEERIAAREALVKAIQADTARIVADLEAKLANALHWKDLMGTKKAASAAALAWAESHGEAVFAGGGWPAVNSMNEWAQALQGRSTQPDAGEKT